MAILIEGMKCSLCKCPILKNQVVVLFSPFVANEVDPLFRFSDGFFHKECFEKEPLAQKVKIRYSEIIEQGKPENRRCYVCGKMINDPDDYLPFGYLTEDSGHPLHRFNFAHFHQSCLCQWPDLQDVTGWAEEQVKEGKWKGKGMNWLLDELKLAGKKTQ